MNDKSKIHDEDALARMIRWCTYRERSEQEARMKINSLGLKAAEALVLLNYLIDRKHVSDNRFATAYARGKFKINQWGKQKIKAMLEAQKIESTVVRKALASIDADKYKATIQKLAQNKLKTLQKEESTTAKKQKLFRYLLSKGYTMAEIKEAMPADFLSGL